MAMVPRGHGEVLIELGLSVANRECSHHTVGSACGVRAGQAGLGTASKDLVRQLYGKAPTGLLRLSLQLLGPSNPHPPVSEHLDHGIPASEY